jgi:hypothetical protein
VQANGRNRFVLSILQGLMHTSVGSNHGRVRSVIHLNMITGYARKWPTPDRFLPKTRGFEQPTAGFAAGKLVDSRFPVTFDHIQCMAAQLRIGLKSDGVVFMIDRAFQSVLKISG